MAFTWQLSELRTQFRSITRRSSTGDISDANVANWINEYYRNHFPDEAKVFDFQTDFTQSLTPTDSGEYTLSDDVIALEEPVTCDGRRIALYTDTEQFFDRYPSGESFVTAPTLAIGTSDTAAVANSAFTYRIGNDSYYKAATETSLSGSAVPANTYGAWMLSIDSDGDITVTEADDNDTGYKTPGLAIKALTAEHTSDCIMGFVTVTHTSAFTPGTTGLDTTGVTDTYTDGAPGLRAFPEAALVQGGKLFVRPKPSDWHQIESQLTLQRPSALTDDTDAPLDARWGPLIATGAAMLFLQEKENDMIRMAELDANKTQLLNQIGRKQKLQWIRDQRTAQPSF